jgi:hypothetical protein
MDVKSVAMLLLLAGLQSLSIWRAPQLTLSGVWHLTALTALTSIRIEGCPAAFKVAADNDDDDDDEYATDIFEDEGDRRKARSIRIKGQVSQPELLANLKQKDRHTRAAWCLL